MYFIRSRCTSIRSSSFESGITNESIYIYALVKFILPLETGQRGITVDFFDVLTMKDD